MITVNQAIYDAAQERLAEGHWRVDESRGILKRNSDELAGSLNTCGYLRLRFSVDGKYIGALAHRVMWEAMYGTIGTGLYVNHIDGDKTNNAIRNLELVTHQANMRHAYATGLKVTLAGDAAPWAKLTSEQVRGICARALSGEKQADIVADYGVRPGAVCEIKSGKMWAAATADLRLAAAS